MITIEREKLEQVLGALEATIDVPCYGGHPKQEAAAAAIKEALAQPAQEPVAQWQKRHHLWTEGAWENSEEHDAKQWRDKAQGWEIRALYTTPQQQEPRNFCPRCGKRTADLTVIHTCTPPRGLEMT